MATERPGHQPTQTVLRPWTDVPDIGRPVRPSRWGRGDRTVGRVLLSAAVTPYPRVHRVLAPKVRVH